MKKLTVHNYLTRENIHFLGIITILVGFSTSRALMTMGQIILLANWLIDNQILKKFSVAFTNKAVLSFLLIIFIHLAGLLYTNDFDYAFRDLRVKWPLLFLPLIFSTTTPLSVQRWRFAFKVFGFVVLLSTFYSAYLLFNDGMFELKSVRNISVVVSHIRYALFICLTIFVFIYFIIFPDKNEGIFRYMAIPVVLWLMIFLLLLRSLTGIVVLGVGIFTMSFYYSGLIRQYVFRLIVRMAILGILLIGISYFIHSLARYNYRIEPKKGNLEKFTENGNRYHHYLNADHYENSHFVYAYICQKELRKEWNERSSIAYKGKDKIGHPLKFTLYRYLTSKGLRKDSAGMSQLTQDDIRAIENGIANHIYLDKLSLYPRLYKVFWEMEQYNKGGDPTGFSVAQRLVYFKTGWHIFLQNPVIGVGTGDVEKYFNHYYEKSDAKLGEKWRLRAHNQFLTIMLTFGIIGIILFLWGLFFPIYYYAKKRGINLPFVLFLAIALLSMLNEDTLETQAGALFFTLFYCMFLWGIEERNIPNRENITQNLNH